MTIPNIAGEAESLIRALRGVRHAVIRSSDAGIESIHVVARDDDAARHMAAHVRSALLAGLAAPVLPDSIHVRVDETHDDDHGSDHDDAPGRDRIRLLRTEPGLATTEPDGDADGDGDGVDAAVGGPVGEGVPAAAVGEPNAPVTARPRLVAVDADRPGDGRVVCRVAIAYDTRVHRAEAVAVDLPGAAAQAAAQAAVLALTDAGIPRLELSGLREVEIAGRDYVLVALRRTGPYTRTRSGSAPIIGSPERSAAEATVAAARDIA